MKHQFDRVLLYTVSLAMLIVVGMGMRSVVSTPKVAFVDISKMVADYTFKKKLEQSSAVGLSTIRKVIDSLEMVRKIGAGTPRIDTQIVAANYAMQRFYEQSNQEISKKVWERLNPLMQEYGKEHDLQLLVGATGTGNVLYGSKAADVTEELTRYINSHFENGK